jgi:DNA end-binding protein Ku
MAPRTSWKGFLKLSLISVPVKAYTANNTSDEVRLNQLHADCNQRVRYRKICAEHGELASDQIVSGYEFGKDQYVVIDPSELSKLRPESDRAVRIEGFVEEDVLDARYFAGRTYYLLPDGVAGERPYALLGRGMTDAGKVAVAWVVIAGREQLVMLRPLEDMLVMSVLHVHKKVKALDEFKESLEEHELGDEELQLTQTLIGASLIQEFDFASYEDAYVERLKELIRLKVDGEEIVQAPDPEEPKIINLMDALKRSVAQAQAATDDDAPAPKKGTKKAAAKKSASKDGAGRKMAPSAKKKAARKRKSG